MRKYSIIKKLSEEKDVLIDDNNRKDTLLIEYNHLKEVHCVLEEKFNNILLEKAQLENQLDTTRVEIQTTESDANRIRQENLSKLEQTERQIQELQVNVSYY